ncbi:MAG: class I SAM-dependent methyltransferase [Spirochaetota bacterium]|nr:class I SAM-dependent methyltransferase [Spirochaetota bacterium]
MKKLKTIIYNFALKLMTMPLFIKPLIKIFSLLAWSKKGSNLCLKEGKFLAIPVHFYSPIPDINDLEERKIWDIKSSLKGINFQNEQQLYLLKDLGKKFATECHFPPHPTQNSIDFYTENNSFSYGCGAILHCMIRNFNPKKIIEIGSGMSSRVISRAIKMNRQEDNPVEYIIIDPYPSEITKNSLKGISKLIESRVELQDLSLFEQLKQNDILFIDSSHSVKIGSDVNFLFLEVIPSLSPGVIIHIHDIALPYEYGKAYATDESIRQFWTEQYLLQSFLCYNNQFEILLALHYLQSECFEDFKKAFAPAYNPHFHKLTSGSFWIRRKIG